MSYIQDVKAMLRYQNLIEKEKTRNTQHPATKLMRKRYFSSLGPQFEDKEIEGPTHGSVLAVGMNPDPRKVKYESKEAEARGEIPEEPRKPRFHISKLIELSDGSVLPERKLSKMSSHNHYIEQQKKLVRTPHGSGGGMRSGLHAVPPELMELLYTGTSEEYEGRYAYLKAKRMLLKPSERVREPLTAAQASSWDLEDFSKTRDWAPAPITGTRGVMLRLWAEDAATLEKSTIIHNNSIAMETVLGLSTKR